MVKKQLSKNKKGVILILTFLFLASCFGFAGRAQAESFGSAGETLDSLARTVNLGKKDFPAMIGVVLYGLLTMLGVLCLVMMVYAGINWVLAQGNQESISKSRAIMKYSAIGAIVVIFSYAFTYYVVNNIVSSVGTFSSSERGAILDDQPTGGFTIPECDAGGLNEWYCSPDGLGNDCQGPGQWRNCGDLMYCCKRTMTTD